MPQKLYIVTMPGCAKCAARLEDLRAEGRPFVEVDGRDIRRTVDGREVPQRVQVEVLAELAWREYVVPVEVEMPECED